MRRLKLALTLLGFGLTLLGFALESRVLIWVAIGVLGAAVALRFVLKRREAAAQSGRYDGADLQ